MLTSLDKLAQKRVVLIHWKQHAENPFEVFSSLKNFCLSYPKYNYNTMTNYLTKARIAYENAEVRIERKHVILKPKAVRLTTPVRKIAPVVRKVLLHQAADETRDLTYWLSQKPEQRLRALTEIVFATSAKSPRMDKRQIIKRRLK